jgi:hypothetical protein
MLMEQYLANIENHIFQMVQAILKNIILILEILVFKYGTQPTAKLA